MNGIYGTSNTSTNSTAELLSLLNRTITTSTNNFVKFRLSQLSPDVKAPYVVFLVLVIILGILGNTLVLAVNYRIARKTVIDVFVSGMGILDVIACFFIVPSRLLELTVNFWIMDSGYLICKTTRYAAHAIVSSSVFIIGLIAVERFQKICRNKPFIDRESCAKKTLAKLIAFTFVLTLPTFIFHNLSENGEQCVFDLSSQISRIYMACICVIFVLLFLLVFALYCLIALKIHKHTKVFDANVITKSNLCNKSNNHSQQIKQLYNKNPGSTTMTGNPSTSTSFIEQTHAIKKNLKSISNTYTDINKDVCNDEGHTGKKTNSQIKLKKHNLTDLFSVAKSSNEAACSSNGIVNGTNRRPSSFELQNRNVLLRLKATRIVIAVTAVFFISWTPPWIATFLGYSEHSKAIIEMYPVLLFAMRSHFISFFINPILYSLMNSRFRRQAKQLFTDLRNC